MEGKVRVDISLEEKFGQMYWRNVRGTLEDFEVQEKCPIPVSDVTCTLYMYSIRSGLLSQCSVLRSGVMWCCLKSFGIITDLIRAF